VYEQYDTLIQGNSLQIPGGDAGVVRVEGHATKALAFSSDVTPRYVRGRSLRRRQAGRGRMLAQHHRDRRRAAGLHRQPQLRQSRAAEIMGQFVHAVQGIGDACRALGFPIVSGNVSLYNETNGRGILPTPTIGGVGLLPDWGKMAKAAFAAEGEAILLFGAPDWWGTHLGQSIYLRDLFGRRDGTPPHVDLEHEKKVGDLVRILIRDGVATAVHDLSDGGLAVGLAEMALASGIGATVNQLDGGDPIPLFFGEDQGRYLVTMSHENLEKFYNEVYPYAGVFAPWIGNTGGTALTLGEARPLELADLRKAHEGWFPEYMAGEIS
jgi:phosphoribosylformylglycinamidine (FGAM) synthase-like enzyme